MKKSSQVPLVSIVIPNFNAKSDLRVCLRSLAKLGYQSFEVIVVDSGSTDGSAEMVSSEFPNVRVIRTKSMGIGEANNVGINAAKGDLILFDLNSDDSVDEYWLGNLVKVINSSREIGIVCGKRYLAGTDRILDSAGAKINFLTGTFPAIGRGKRDSPKYNSLKEVDYVPVLLAKKEVFKKIGLCDPTYYVYFEEPDFCLRARKAGFKTVYVPDAVFFHRRSSTVGEKSPRKQYYVHRNRIVFIIRHFPSTTFILPLMVHLILLTMCYMSFFAVRRRKMHFLAQKDAALWILRNLRNLVQARYQCVAQDISK